MDIPFVDLARQFAANGNALLGAISEVCYSTNYILGPYVETFEDRFAEYCGAKHAIGVGSGTDALRLGCEIIGIEGKEVLIPANTFMASAVAVLYAGGTPVPVDINAENYLIDLEDAKRKLTSRSMAIMPVHLYGQAVDMDALMAFATTYNLRVIEDACQAHGAYWKGKRVGTFGDFGCFSFYPSKNLGGIGDGGMIVTNDSELDDTLRRKRNHGSVRKYAHEIVGTNSRLDAVQAAVLNVKLDMLNQWNAKRFRAACRYTDLLKGLKAITTPQFAQDRPDHHVFHLYVIRCKDRDELSNSLAGMGVHCQVHYPVPFHLQPAFASLGCRKGDCPRAEEAANDILSLPLFPEITEEEIEFIVDHIKRHYA